MKRVMGVRGMRGRGEEILGGEQTNQRTKVVQEVLADLKSFATLILALSPHLFSANGLCLALRDLQVLQLLHCDAKLSCRLFLLLSLSLFI